MKEKSYNIDESIGFWVYRMHIRGVAVLKRSFQSAGYDVTPEQWGLMMRLGECEGANQSQLGEKAFKDRHNTTRILNQLVRRGYVERRPDDTDKRAFRLYLTKTGREVKTELIPVVLHHYTSAFRGINDKALLSLRKILGRIVENLENMPV